jgi:hypothetical protein
MSGFRPMNNGDMIGLGETVTLGYERKAYASETVIGGGMANQCPTTTRHELWKFRHG